MLQWQQFAEILSAVQDILKELLVKLNFEFN